MSSSVGRVLAVVSQKGGVGKTTTAVNLAAALAKKGTRTLLVDADPQGSVRHGIGLAAGHEPHGLADFLAGERTFAEVILPTVLPSLKVLLVGTVTDRADHGGFQRRVSESRLLSELLAAARTAYDVVVVDTPPGLGGIVGHVLRGSQHVIIPLQCEPLALQTTPQILRGIQDAASSNAELTVDGLLLTMLDESSESSRKVAEYVRAEMPQELVLDVAIPRSAAAVDAFGAGQPVVLRDPDDAASRAYVQLAALLRERFGL
ncbi:MAG: ParA family protein [Gemmatimonadaceae bacterium]